MQYWIILSLSTYVTYVVMEVCIVGQTYRDLEIIIVDDGSPDNCGAICDEYAAKDGRITVIHKENGGLSTARNDGTERATGEWIAFIDSDDWCELEYYEQLNVQHLPIKWVIFKYMLRLPWVWPLKLAVRFNEKVKI